MKRTIHTLSSTILLLCILCFNAVAKTSSPEATARCQDITIQLDADGSASIVATQINNSSGDPDDFLTFSLDISEFDCSNIGENTVILGVLDQFENFTSCESIVTVEDTTPPNASCFSTAVVLDATGQTILSPDIFNNNSTDNCGAPLEFSLSRTVVTCDDLASAPLIILTVTDASGNSDSCNGFVTVIDNIGPSISCNQTTVELDADGTASITVDDIATYTDNCPINAAIRENSLSSFTCENLGVQFVFVEFSNEAGAILSSCGAAVTITDPSGICGCQDNEIPNAICNDLTITLDDNGTASISVADIDNNSTDDCEIISTTLNNTDFDCDNLGANTVILTVTDAVENVGTCEATVTVENEFAPTLVGVADDITLECGGFIQPPPNVTGQDFCGNNLTVTFSQDFEQSSNCPIVFVNTRFYSATDAFGNTITQTQTITIVDNEGPILQAIPADITISCGDPIPPQAEIIVTECTTSFDLSVLDTPIDDCTNQSIERKWTATDDCGNESTAIQIITVVDNEAPTLTTLPPSEIELICGDVIPSDAPGAIDNCSENLTKTFNDVINSTNATVRTWTIADDCGNFTTWIQTITSIEDTTAPVITGLPEDITIDCDGDIPTSDVTATDDCDENVEVIISVFQTPGECPVGIILTREYTATDAAGNSVTQIQTVTIENLAPPVLSNVPADATINCGADLLVPDVTASDACPGSVEITFEESEVTTSGNCLAFTRTWTATDICGNQASETQNITIIDELAPTLSGVPADVTINCGDELPSTTDVVAIDECSDASIFFIEIQLEDCTNSIRRSWTATDGCGNEYTEIQNITIEDNDAPEFVSAPVDITVACGEVPDFLELEATDCGSIVPGNSGQNIEAIGNLNIITRNWSVTDACGNTAVWSQTITEDCTPDVEEIVVDCSDDITVSCDLSGTHVSWEEPTATSTCTEGTSTCEISVPYYIDMGIHNGHRYFCSQSNSLSWAQARQTAAAYGGYLVVINDATENEFIRDAIIAPTCWLGLTDEVNEGNFVWEGGQNSNYSNWLNSEPNNQDNYYSGGADHVVLIKSDGKWRDRAGQQHHEFIIEIPCDESGLSITQTSGPTNGGEFPEGTTTVSYDFTDACGSTASCSFDVTVETCPEPADYCDVWGNSYYEYIQQVCTNDFSNWSGNNGGYADFTNYSSEMYSNCLHYIYLRPGYTWNSYTSYWKVWIDWNQDGDFSDAGELVVACRNSYGRWYGIHVPADASPGATRMRVAMKYGGYPQPCGSVGYGEVEDYTIYVNSNAPLIAEDIDELQASRAFDNTTSPFTAYYNERDADGNFVRIKSNETVDIFPNPASNQISIVLNQFENEDAVYEIYHSTGVLMEKINNVTTNTTVTVNTSHYESGVYTVLLKVNGQVKQSVPFVKISDK